MADLEDFFKEIEETEKQALQQQGQGLLAEPATAGGEITSTAPADSASETKSFAAPPTSKAAPASAPAGDDEDVDISKLLFGINPAGPEVAAMAAKGLAIRPTNVKPAAAAFAPRAVLAAKARGNVPHKDNTSTAQSSSSSSSGSSSSSDGGWKVAVVAQAGASRLPTDESAAVGSKRRRPEDDLPPAGAGAAFSDQAFFNGSSTAAAGNGHVSAPAPGSTSSSSGPPDAQATAGDQTQQKGNSRFTGKGILRTCAGEVWVDKTLAEWPENDFRLFCGDLGNEVTDEILAGAFAHLPSFAKARVIRDPKTFKSKGYGFVSLLDASDALRAMKEIHGQYIGNRPVRIRKVAQEEKDYGIVKMNERKAKAGGAS